MIQKKKVDSKTRFQHPSFRNQLQEARGYKRSSKSLRPREGSEVLQGVGLRSALSKIFFVLILGVVIYGIFGPTFLSVQTIVVQGSSSHDTSALTQNYFKEHFFSAQKNIIFLSTADLARYIKSFSDDVVNVDIKKKFFHTIIITLSSRKNTYALSMPSSHYIVSSDGYVHGQTLADFPTSTPLTGITIGTESDVPMSGYVFTPAQLSFFQQITLLLPQKTGAELDHFYLDQLSSTTVTIFTKSSFRLLIDQTMPAADILGKVQLVLGQLSPAQKANTVYIDMRIPDKSFICFKNTPCAVNKPITPENNPTTTDTTILSLPTKP